MILYMNPFELSFPNGYSSCFIMFSLLRSLLRYEGGTRLSKRADPVCYSDIMSDFNTDCDRYGR